MEMTIDPNSNFDLAPRNRLIGACGIIPHFAKDAQGFAADGREAVLDAMIRYYGFPCPKMDGVTLDEKHRWTYPGDPKLDPLMTLDLGFGVKVRIYQYAFVAVSDEHGTDFVRMD